MKNLFRLLLIGACSAGLMACSGEAGEGGEGGEGASGGDVTETDGGTSDGGDMTDGGEADGSGEADGGETDADETDAGETDAGETDAGETDAGETDAGEADGGEADGSGETDAGETDAGEADGSGETDAGETDAGPIDCTDDEADDDTLETATPLGCGVMVGERVAARGNVDIYQGTISIGERFVTVIETTGDADLIEARVVTPDGATDPTSATAVDGDTVIVYSGDPFGFESGSFFLEVTSSGCVDYTVTGTYCVDPFPFNEGDPVDVAGIAATECALTDGSCGVAEDEGGM